MSPTLGHGPSNAMLLTVAFVSFLSFAAVQTVFAIIGNSSAMLADSATMFVDAFTYCGNMIAERKKNSGIENQNLLSPSSSSVPLAPSDSQLEADSSSKHVSATQKALCVASQHELDHIKLEIITPAISVVTLMAVTLYTSIGAFSTIQTVEERIADGTDVDKTNVTIMLVFSSVNLLIDFVNMAFFACQNHLTGFNTDDSPSDGIGLLHDRYRIGSNIDEGESDSLDDAEQVRDVEPAGSGQSPEDRGNMNMCSAYTHVLADTMRSVAVLVAALVASLSSVQADLSDAYAALVVSAIIIVTTVPLIFGLYKASRRYKVINQRMRQILESNSSSNGTPFA